MILEVLGISSGIVGIIICLILGIRQIKHYSSQLSASPLIGFMLSQIFFNVGLSISS